MSQYICRIYEVHNNSAVLKKIIVVTSAKRLNLYRYMFLSINATTHVPLPTTFVSDIFQTSSFPKEKNRNISAYKKMTKVY
jgi:hypothetical protein